MRRNIVRCLNDDTPLVEVSWVRMSMQSVGFILSVLARPPFSERILKLRVVEIAGLVRPRFVDKCTGEKIAVARVTLQVAREVIVGEKIGFRADVAGRGSGSRTEHSRGLVVDRIGNGGSPEEILL